MEKRGSALALRHMRTLFGVGAAGGLSDAELLDRFLRGHREAAEAAFTTLVERHGAMVHRVCRGVLGDSPDVHDAFQATFLVLVRKASSLWVRDSLGPWLHGVALRVAKKAKVAAARRKAHERQSAEMTQAGRGESRREDLVACLHDEVERLPLGKYRAPVVLCYLEGLTHESAAEALGCPVGTVRGRLARARDLLRSRFVRRGLAPSAEAFAAILLAEEASGAPLSASVIQAVLSLVAERSAVVAPAAVTALAKGALRTMTLAKLKTVLMLALLGLVALGLTEAAQSKLSFDDQNAATKSAPLGKTVPETWPAGVEVRGRVIDHQGRAIAGADVLLLRDDERLMVWAQTTAERTVSYKFTTEPSKKAGFFGRFPGLYNLVPHPLHASVKTDAKGRYTLPPSASPADRIAVVCEKMLLWEATRKQFTDTNEFLIELPEPGELRIRSEVTERSGPLIYGIEGRPTNRTDRQSDCVYWSIPVLNPGEHHIRSLVPARYAIGRFHEMKAGPVASMIYECERRLFSVESGKRTEVVFDRKKGRQVEGRVRGLEDVELRFAILEVSYWGPAEQFGPGDELA